ncbi:prolyl oligopeptidase family serine peptidase [Aquirufa sp.]|jgi:dipeptidyl aminopeptidase/acylaminoacyl peptidase|uniref:prolyl oligopeptidase family serine peptidase n=1 Tax=Aquirufa sp. TaxID=2676249 RepID=UPI0037BE6073
MMRKLFVILLLSFGAFAQKNIQVTDLLKIKSVGKPSFSPDGQKFLFTVTSVEDDPETKGDFVYQTHLYVGDVATKSTRAMTSGKFSISAPNWAPDGKSILFTRDLGNKAQVFQLSLAGGEALALTNSKVSVQNSSISKFDGRLYFQSGISLKDFYSDSLANPRHLIPSWTLEKPNVANQSFVSKAKANPNGMIEEVRAYLSQNEKDKKAKVINRLNFQEETATSGEIQLSTLFAMSLEAGAKPVAINNPLHRWSDWEQLNANTFVVILPADSLSHPDKVGENQLVRFDLTTNTYKSLLIKPGHRYSNVTVSNNGEQVAFFESKSTGVSNAVLKVLNMKNGQIHVVNLDRVITQVKWSADDQKLYISPQDHGGVPLLEYTIASQQFKTLTSVADGVLGFDVAGDQLIYTKTSIENPSELYMLQAGNERTITDFNASWVRQKSLSKAEKHTFINKLGQTIDYWVMKPVGYVAGQKYPLVVEIHGGPTAMWGTGEASMWHEFQYYTAKGWGVVYCNPRGSGGYGTPFMASNVKDWGAGPMADVMQATDLAIKEGWADTTRLAVTGGSYAGYLVAWIVGHSNRFKVAATQRGVYELSTFFGEGNAWRLVPNYFGGYPWEKATRAILDRESPLTYVANIKTPLIIFHGENDLRTGVIQSEMLYKSLKQMGRTVEYVRHPGASHEITRAGNNRQRIDQMLRTWEFFARYLE